MPAGILVIDDTRSRRILLADLLRLARHEVLQADDGASGLAAIQSERPDLVLLDAMLPDGNSRELAQHLKHECGYFPPPVVILLCAQRVEVADIISGLDLGADDCIVRPFDEGELFVRVAAALRLRSQQKDLARLAAGEAKYRQLVETTEEGVWQIDARGILVFANRRVAEMLDCGMDELIGKSFADLLVDEDIPRARQALELRRRGETGRSEYRLRKKNGAHVWAAVSSTPLFDAGGTYLGATGVATDISERKRREEVQAHEQRLLRQIAGNYPLSSVMEDLCRVLEELSHRPLHVTVMLVDPEGRRFECIAAPGLPAEFRESRAATLLEGSGTACAQAVRTKFPAIIADTALPGVSPETSEMRQAFGFGAVWSYPIIQDGETLGTLALLPLAAGMPDNEDECLIEFALQVARLAIDHERNDRVLRESEQRFRDFADMAADWFWEQDAEFRFTNMSGGVLNKGHFHVADSLGKTRWELPIEGLTEAQWAAHRTRLERHEPFHDFVYKIHTRNGELRWYSVNGKPVHAPDGAFLGYRGVGRDITARVTAEERLTEAKKWLQLAIRAANIGLWERVVDTWEFRFSPEWKAQFGYAEGEIEDTAEQFDRLVHPDDLERIHAFAHAFVANPDGDYENEFRVRHKDGTWRWVLSRGALVTDPSNGQRRWMGCHVDITDQVRAEEQIRELNATLEERVMARTAALEAANRELDAFNYSVSHDLRAPLRSIDGFSLALLEDYDSRLDAEGREHLSRIRAAAQRMAGLIDAMFNLSRLSRQLMQIREVDLSGMARAIVAELREHDPGREVEVEIAGNLIAEGDAGLLRIVLTNLIGNAWKYTGRTTGARIEFGARRNDNGFIEYHVADNGAGFDMQFEDKLFRLFHRLHRDEEFTGQGVGLATVQRIVRRHGGRIWAHAEKGRGATFFFTLWENPTLRRETEEVAEQG